MIVNIAMEKDPTRNVWSAKVLFRFLHLLMRWLKEEDAVFCGIKLIKAKEDFRTPDASRGIFFDENKLIMKKMLRPELLQ